jgi:hypothetical protein
MGEKEIIKVLELAKYDELRNLQWKVEYLRNEVTNTQLLIYFRRMNSLLSPLGFAIPMQDIKYKAFL